jgi:hypothetical protein
VKDPKKRREVRSIESGSLGFINVEEFNNDHKGHE